MIIEVNKNEFIDTEKWSMSFHSEKKFSGQYVGDGMIDRKLNLNCKSIKIKCLDSTDIWIELESDEHGDFTIPSNNNKAGNCYFWITRK